MRRVNANQPFLENDQEIIRTGRFLEGLSDLVLTTCAPKRIAEIALVAETLNEFEHARRVPRAGLVGVPTIA